jgi:uncharacterized protein YbaR (Trm112 family)
MLDVLCEIVRCPLTSRPLQPVEHSELGALNAQIASGSMHQADGAPVDQLLSQALRTPDGQLAYRCDGGILALLPQLALRVGGDDPVITGIDPAKQVVQEFYDNFGWLQLGEQYLDTIAFVDTRPLAMDYLQRCHQRVRRHLPASGRSLLDAASGPVHYDEYRRFSEGFDFRVCVDLSVLALREAQRSLGVRGLYVLGDMAQLPFRDGVFDAAVSLHSIYHVPAQE